jgi:hypothetical protein
LASSATPRLAPTLFSIDNKGLLDKLKNFGSNPKTINLNIKIKSLREKFKKRDIDVKLITSEATRRAVEF